MRGLGLALLLVGCGDNRVVYCDHGQPIELTTTSPFVEYRDGDHEWLVPERTDDYRYVMCVDDDYVVLTACRDSFIEDDVVWQEAATLDDGPLEIFACAIVGEALDLHTVSGDVEQAGTLAVGNFTQFSSIGPWHYEARTRGIVDIVATDNEQLHDAQASVAIRRGIRVDTDLVQPLLDVATEGTPMVALALSIANLDPADRISVDNTWITKDAITPISRSSTTTILTLADQLVAADDLQEISFSTSTGNHSRGFVTEWPGEADLALLPVLSDDIAFENQDGMQAVTWTELPSTFTDVSLFVSGTDIHHVIRASRSWLERTGITSLSLDRSSPSFDSSWSIPDPAFLDFDAIRETELSMFYTSTNISKAAPARPIGCAARGRSLRAPPTPDRDCPRD